MSDNTSTPKNTVHYIFAVNMSCGGCSGAVKRALLKNANVTESQFIVNHNNKESVKEGGDNVLVSLPEDGHDHEAKKKELREIISKTGKKFKEDGEEGKIHVGEIPEEFLAKNEVPKPDAAAAPAPENKQ